MTRKYEKVQELLPVIEKMLDSGKAQCKIAEQLGQAVSMRFSYTGCLFVLFA